MKPDQHIAAFIFKAMLLLTIVGVITYAAMVAHPTVFVDSYYKKLTTDRAGSLILGSSRALQGLQPQHTFAQLPCDTPNLNFAFSISCSPYGELYTEQVKKKLLGDVRNGVFIFEVNPLTISIANENHQARTRALRETGNRLDLFSVNQKPNIEYLLVQYRDPLYNLFLPEEKVAAIAHPNGWVETVKVLEGERFDKKLDETVSFHQENYFSKLDYSEYRVQSLNDCVEFLKQRGLVCLVRLPVHQRIKEQELQFMPQFDHIIDSLSITNDVPYFNFIDSANYLTTDGHHLIPESGKRVSKQLNELIQRSMFPRE